MRTPMTQVEEWAAAHRLKCAAPAFLAACQGPHSEPGMDRLSALNALLGGLEEEGYGPETTDPDATIDVLRECRALLDGLRAAMKLAEGVPGA